MRVSLILLILFTSVSQAGVFTTPSFVEAGKWSFGIEPEIVFSSPASLGFNARYTHGLSDLNNFAVIGGTGGGNRLFRGGALLTFDFFPDIEGQPGIGVALSGMYLNTPTHGEFDLTALPYIHKTFKSGESDFDPFFSIPFGMRFIDGNYKAISTAVIGSNFKASDHFNYTLELGVAINNTHTYLSGGCTYRY